MINKYWSISEASTAELNLKNDENFAFGRLQITSL
jgi:hypothetical protein